MRFHVVSLPHTQTTKDFVHCAYTEKVRKFCAMMKSLGHTVYLYASEENEAPCDELVTCITKQEQKDLIGIDSPADNLKAKFDPSMTYWLAMNGRAIREIMVRRQPRDFICLIGGVCQRQIAEAFPDMISVEFGIGYDGTFAKYRVFESYAWMHAVYGAQQGASQANGAFFDTVIPNYYDPADFPLVKKKADYFLYIGRLTDRKGFTIAIDVCKAIGAKLVVAGQGTPPAGVEYRGLVGAKERAELMGHAKAVFVPTLYLEPFGGVSVEAMMCGTPVITTDWGAFTENVIEGETGYRCRTLAEFIQAAKQIDNISPEFCHTWAVDQFSMNRVKYRYEAYFRRLESLWGDGWYEKSTAY